MYKCADYVHNDRSSVLCSREGIEQNLQENFVQTHQIQRWLNLLETVYLMDETDTNLKFQARYLKVIASFCKTRHPGKFKIQFQMQVINRIFHYEPNIPLWFGLSKRSEKTYRPYIFF